MRTEDILACTRVASTYESGEKPNRVHLISIGRVGPPALHAVALERERFASARFERCLSSWTAVVRTPLAVRQLENAVHGALHVYDLPDLARTLSAEQVTFVNSVDALGSIPEAAE
jgi:hypothetical protein